MKLLVQEFLEIKSFKDLEKEYGVYSSFSKCGSFWSMNYDQIESKESDLLSQQCRGLILSCDDGRSLLPIDLEKSPGKTKILSYPMDRFFNLGQGSAANINWHDPKLSILEKLDGSLCIVWYNPFTDKWNVGTRSRPEADLLMDNGIFTFKTLFEKALKDTTGLDFDNFIKYLNHFHTYCFELTTPYNRIVVEYKNCSITLLAARDLITHLEVYPDQCEIVKTGIVPCVQAYSYTSVQELVDWVSTLNPLQHEGIVVRDGNFNRIKVKNANYIVYNKIRDCLGTSERNIVELILAEKDDDVISMLPEEIVKNLQKIKTGVQAAIKKYDEIYLNVKAQADTINPGDKKTFAILVTKDKTLWNAPFFQMFDGKVGNMKDFIMKNRKNGTWGDNFLDKILEIAKQVFHDI